MKRGKRHSRRLLTIKSEKHCVRFKKKKIQFIIRSKAAPHGNRKEGEKKKEMHPSFSRLLFFFVCLFFSFHVCANDYS